jgi:glycosyltransferase EpsD
VGGFLARLAAKKYRKKGMTVIYTAHGFHFFKGAPIKNWLLFYPVEWLCSWWTDVLLTINQEDYQRAKKHLHAKKVTYVPGVGINIEKFQDKPVSKEKIHKELGISEHDIFVLSVGELSKRKNHEVVIKAIGRMHNPKIKYFICGQGGLRDELNQLIEGMNLQENVRLLGYRTDICELCKTADLFVFPSLQEGLPVALMEAIACGTLVVCSKIRGNIDLIKEESCMFNPLDNNNAFEIISNNIERIMNREHVNVVSEIVKANAEELQKYDVKMVEKDMIDVYSQC